MEIYRIKWKYNIKIFKCMIKVKNRAKSWKKRRSYDKLVHIMKGN